MTYTLKWIKENLGNIIATSIQGTPYTEDWLAAIAYRETGGLIDMYAYKHLRSPVLFSLMRGDYTQRHGEDEKSYHGYGFWQIDIGSFPDFVKSGDWKDPAKTCAMAIKVLEGKRKYITEKMPGLNGDALERAITAAYNCGEGNVMKALINREDVDHFTTGQDYSKVVFQAREVYKNL